MERITDLNKSKTKVSVIIDKEVNNDEDVLRLGYGSILGSYTFNKYKTKNFTKNVLSLIEIFSPNSYKT